MALEVQASFLGRSTSMPKRGGGGSNHGGGGCRSFVFRADDSNSMAPDSDADPDKAVRMTCLGGVAVKGSPCLMQCVKVPCKRLGWRNAGAEARRRQGSYFFCRRRAAACGGQPAGCSHEDCEASSDGLAISIWLRQPEPNPQQRRYDRSADGTVSGQALERHCGTAWFLVIVVLA